MNYTLVASREPNIMLVGCGGTGGFVAEGLCRLMPAKDRLYLVDHDRIEERNLGRQNFYADELGQFKSEALARRLSRQFRREVAYSVLPVEHLPLDFRSDITIGCVDNAAARDRLQYAGSKGMGGRFSYAEFNGWYIDSGNSEHSGQVLIGNDFSKRCSHAFSENGACNRLPLPQAQQPALLAQESKPRPDCARAVQNEEQSPVINRVMADLVLTFVQKLIKGTMGWMAAYVDLDSGNMNTVPASPENVAHITGHTLRQLVYHPRKANQ